jgi:uncharacterized membrane protein
MTTDLLPVDAPQLDEPVVAPRRRRLSAHRLAVGVLVLAAAGLYSACGFAQFVTYRATTFDLVIFDQVVRGYSHGQLPVSIAKGVHNGFGAGFVELGDHFSPTVALLAPLYWIFAGPETLLVAQGVLFASAIVPLWVFTRREIGPFAAYGVAIGYGLSWPVAQAVNFDFHEVAFAPVLIALVFERLSALRRGSGTWWHVVVVVLLLLGVKEDMGLLVAGFGLTTLVLSIRSQPGRRILATLGGAFVIGGLAWGLVVSRVVVPAFGGRVDTYWHYGRFGNTPGSAAARAISRPLDVVRTFLQPQEKRHLLRYLFTIPLFAPLCSPYLLVVLPLLAERLLSDAPHWWSTDFHYNAFLVVPLLCAGVDGVARVQRWVGRAHLLRGNRFAALWAVAVVGVAVQMLPTFGFGQITSPGFWQPDGNARSAADAVAHVPSGVIVEAPNNVGPHLSERTTVVLLDHLPRWAPWVVVNVSRAEFPFCQLAEQRARVGFLKDHGYRVVYAEGAYLVLNHPAALPPLNTAPSPDC